MCVPFMIVRMRITISLDDGIFKAVKRRAEADGRGVSAHIASMLEDAVKRDNPPSDERKFRLITAGGGGPYPHVPATK